MRFKCLNCGQTISDTDTDARTSVTKCPGCGKLFLKKDLLQSMPAAFLMPEVDKPGRFSVKLECDDTVISFRWFSFDTVILLFFCLIVDYFAVFVCSNLFKTFPLMLKNATPLPFMVFAGMIGLFPAVIGTVLTYYIAAGFVNRTFIRLSRGGLTIRSGPLPWHGDRAFLKSDLDRLSCEEKRTRKGGRYYQVLAVMRDGSDVTLPLRFYAQEEALFIEQQAAKVLGLREKRGEDGVDLRLL